MTSHSYRWIIAGLSFLALFASIGVQFTFGAFIIPWEESFASTRGTISLISFVGLIVGGWGMAVAGKMTDRFGPRRVLVWSMVLIGMSLAAASLARSLWHLTLLYGVIASIGFAGISPVTTSAAIMTWFKDRRGLVLGASNGGIAVGQMVLVPLSIFMIQAFEWRLTLLVFGLLFLVILAPLFWLTYRDQAVDSKLHLGSGGSDERTSPARNTSNTTRSGERAGEVKPDSFVALMRHPITWLIMIPYFVCGVTDIGLFNIHFIPLAEGRSFSSQVIVAVITLNALANLVGVVFTGYLTDKVRLTLLLNLMYGIRGASVVLLVFAYDPPTLLVFGLLHGVTTAATIAPTAALCARIYGSHQAVTVFGIASLFHQLGAAAASAMMGLLFDLTLSYNLALILSIGMLAMGVFMTWLIDRYKQGYKEIPTPSSFA